MTGLLGDLKHALRVYRRTPLSSLIAVGVFAIAMAFVGAFLSLYVDQVLRPNPAFEDSGRLVTMGQNDGTRLIGLPHGLIERMADDLPALDAAVGVQTFQQMGPDGESVIVELVTKGYFDSIRPRLALGRGFALTEHEADAEPVAVVAYDYWQDKLDGRPEALDTTIELALSSRLVRIGPDGARQEPETKTVDFRIVGVMAREVRGLQVDDVAVWIPLERAAPALFGVLPRSLSVPTLGRLSPGASAAALVRQLSTRYADSDEEFNLQPGYRLDAVPGVVRNVMAYRDTKRQLTLFLTASVLLALVAVCNVSLFLLARAPGRRRELGIRMSVGAPPRRLARQLASEAALLVVASAVLGLVVSYWLSGFLRGLAFLRRAQWHAVSLADWRVLGLIALFLLLVTLLVSLAPVLGLKKLGIAASSRSVAARATLAQRAAGTLQIAIAGTLAGAAIAFGWYLAELSFAYPGFQTRNLYAVRFAPNASGVRILQPQVENAIVDANRRREAIEALPGVSAASFGSPIPGAEGGNLNFGMRHPDDPNRQLRFLLGSLDSHYVDLLGLRLVSGRAPTDSDGPVCLVNQALARAVFGREDVVGESLPFAVPGGERTEIIGVLEDISFGHPAADVEPVLFSTASPAFLFQPMALVEATLTGAALRQALERLGEDGALELKVVDVAPLRRLRQNVIAADRARSLLTIFTAALVVLIAGLGFYGTQRYLVTAGRREYAIRASIGAGPRALGRLVLGRGLMLGLPGLVIGAVLGFTAVAWLRGDFVSRDISPGLVTIAVIAGLTVLLLAASLGPARQARRTQPAPLLREE